MSLSIIIVNYKTPELVIDCLQSVYAFTRNIAFEVIVVDNHSQDNSRELITTLFPPVHWVQQEYNSGFARGNNAGMRKAEGEVYLLLNPDTLIEEYAIERCYTKLIHSSYVAAGVQMLNPDRTFQISGNFFMKGGINHLLSLPYWGGFLRWLGYKTKRKIPNVAVAKAEEEVEWISGAFLMVKKEALDIAGLMDEDFFLYAEEVEWCSRLQKAGKLCIFGELHIIHIQGEAINKDQKSTERGYQGLYDKKALQLLVSNHVRVRKQFGVGWFLFLLLNYSWGVIVFAIVGFLHRLFTLRNPVEDFRKIAALGKNVAYVWSLAPTIIRNKPHFYKIL